MRAAGFLLSLFVAFAGLASTEHAVGVPELGPAPYFRFATSVGSDGTDFFVAWTDYRAPWSSIIGTRVKASGEILDPTGIPIAIASAQTSAQAPLVVWGGNSYLVFFTNFDSRISTSNLFVVRVDREGRILGPRQLLATEAATAGGHFAASNGSRTVVGYRNARTGEVRALMLDQEATKIADLHLDAAPGQHGHVSVAARGSEFTVVWHTLSENATIEGVRIKADGQLLDAAPRTLGNGLNPEIASDGNGYALIALRSTENALIWTSRMVSAGLDEISEVRDLPDGRLLQYPSLLFRGDEYEVVAQRVDDRTGLLSLSSIRIHDDGSHGELRFLGTLPYGGFDPQPGAGANGNGRLFVAWNDSTRELFSSHMIGRVYLGDALPAVTSDLLLSLSADPHYAPALASNGSGFLAVWGEIQGFWATRITRDGQSIDGRGILLDAGRPDESAVVFDGTSYVVASSHQSKVRVRYISPDTGAVQATLTLGENGGAYGAALAVDKDALFVAWADRYGIQLTRIPHATRVPETPVLVSPNNELSPYGDYATHPALASNGKELLVTWTIQREIVGSPPYTVSVAVHGARVAGSTLSLLDPAPFVISEIDGGTGDESSVASNGKDWLVTWNAEQSVFARRVRRDTGIDGQPTAVVGAGYGAHNVAWDGARYVIAWKELDWESFPLRLGYVSASGAIVPAVTTVTEETLTPQSVFGLAPSPFGLGLAYIRNSTAPEHGSVERTFLRLVTRQDKRRAVR